jgi:hypothetical protein
MTDFRQRDTKEDDMPVDFWTKMALTLIAVSLAVIAWKLPVADVGHAQNGDVRKRQLGPMLHSQ